MKSVIVRRILFSLLVVVGALLVVAWHAQPQRVLAQDAPPVRQGYQVITATDPGPGQTLTEPVTPTAAASAIYVYEPKPMYVPPSLVLVSVPISVDISTLDGVQAGDWLTYVYRLVNTSTTDTIGGIIVDATWSNLTGSNKWQVCNPIDCAPAYVLGVSVVVTNAPSGVNARYLVGNLGPGATAEFGVRLKIEPDQFPETGQAIKRPSGSAKAYANNNLAQLISQDTANSTIVGPVLVLTKTAVVNPPVYVNEPLEWVLRIGNATATGDQLSGVYRADARLGTNVLVFDDISSDEEFVSATGSYVADSNMITWTVGSLPVGSFQEVRVRFKKRDVRDTCFKLRNTNYESTSDEFAWKTVARRYTVSPNAVTANLLPPVNVPSVTVSPGTIYYGDEALITVTAQNNYSMPLTGVIVRYKLRPETEYVLGSANMTPYSLPVGAGGEMLWQFDMAAGTRYTPTLQNLSFKVKARYFDTNLKGYGMLDSSGSVPLPIQCATTLESANYNGPRKDLGGPEVKARLLVTHTADTDAQEIESRTYLVTRGTNVRGVITVTNRSSVAATNTTVLAALPGSPNANLAYVSGTATLNGVPLEPDFVLNGNAGGISWSGINIPARGTIFIHYTVKVIDGYDYVILVTEALAVEVTESDQSVSNNASIPCTPWNLMCLKLQPRIGMSKVSEQPSVGPGEEVTFTLSIGNEEGYSITLGIVDALWDFDYVRQITGYTTPATTTVYLGRPVNALRWPSQVVGPGQTLTARYVARMPGPTCVKSLFDNELLFDYKQPDNVVSMVRRIPPFQISVACRSVKYKKTAAINVANLLGVVTFTLTAQNTDVAQSISNVQAVDVLPAGFSFISMDTSGSIVVPPAQEVRVDGRTVLTWTFDLPVDTKYDIKYRARAGSTVSTAENWYIAQASTARGWCQTPCRVVTETVNSVSTPITYSYDSVDVQPLLTLSPDVTPTACALPSDLRLYRLSIVNANTQPYVQITATVALPLGVRFNRVVSGTTAPQVTVDGGGIQTLKWTDLAVNAKPANQYAAQLDLWVELKIGQAVGSLDIIAQASSFDTLIPRRDGVQDPSIQMCVLTNAILVKNVSQSSVLSGTIVTYEVLLANPGNSPIAADVDDVMPPGATYVADLNGHSPQINGQTLTWPNIVVPAATATLLGTELRTYQVRLSGLNVTHTTTTQVTTNAGLFNPSSVQSTVYVQAPGATISGVVFVDFNMNGVSDAGDAPLGNVSVSLRNSAGGLSVVLTQIGLGAYVFTNVVEGPYTLTVNNSAALVNTTPAVLTGTVGPGATIQTVFGLASAPTLSIAGISVAEGASGTTVASLSLTMTRAVSVPVSVRYTTVDTATAKQGTDFVYASAVVAIPAGSTATTIPINVNGDTAYEADETFYVNLSAPVNGKLGAAQQAVVTVLNDDALPSVSVASASVLEGASGSKVMNFTISLSAVSGITTSVTVSTAALSASASDFVPTLLTVDIPPGVQAGTVDVTVNGDILYELDETFLVLLSNPVNTTLGQASATGTIQNDDALPTLAIDDVGLSEGNAGSRSAVFTLTLSAVAGVPVTVSYSTADGTATAPGDYTAATATKMIAAGVMTAQITITTRGDLIYEPDETFVVNLSSPVNAALSDGQGVGTIRNDDKQPSTPALAISDATINETNSGTTTMVFTVTLSSASSTAVSVTYTTVNGTAIAPTDFVAASGTLVIPANALSRTITVTVNGDTTVESDETYTVELSNAFNATIASTQAMGTIKNDDVTQGGGGSSYKIFVPLARK